LEYIFHIHFWFSERTAQANNFYSCI
jgi:hypothetical protein